MEKYTYTFNADGERIAHRTKEWIALQAKSRNQIKYKEAGVPSTKWGYSFDTYKGSDPSGYLPMLKKFVKEFEVAKGVNLYLWSKKNSTQKSTMAAVVAMGLIEKGYKVRFVLMSILSNHLQRETFEEDSKQFIEDLADVDFLVVDDAFDPKKAVMYKSGYQKSFLDTFLRNRMEVEALNTCFTSNFAIEEISESYGPSIYALVKRSVPKPMLFDESIHDFNPDKFWS